MEGLLLRPIQPKTRVLSSTQSQNQSYIYFSKFDECGREERNLSWPKKTNIWCFHCCHPFQGVPIPIPCHYCPTREQYTVTGTYCSFACAAAWLRERNFPDATYQRSLLSRMARRIFGFIGPIQVAPPVSRLYVFGGDMSIDEFRDFTGKQNAKQCFLRSPPLVLNLKVLEEHLPFRQGNESSTSSNSSSSSSSSSSSTSGTAAPIGHGSTESLPSVDGVGESSSSGFSCSHDEIQGAFRQRPSSFPHETPSSVREKIITTMASEDHDICLHEDKVTATGKVPNGGLFTEFVARQKLLSSSTEKLCEEEVTTTTTTPTSEAKDQQQHVNHRENGYQENNKIPGIVTFDESKDVVGTNCAMGDLTPDPSSKAETTCPTPVLSQSPTDRMVRQSQNMESETSSSSCTTRPRKRPKIADEDGQKIITGRSKITKASEDTTNVEGETNTTREMIPRNNKHKRRDSNMAATSLMKFMQT